MSAEDGTGGAEDRGHWPHGSRNVSERRFLADGHGRRIQLAGALRVFGEYVRGLRHLHGLGPTVTVFGSARFREDEPYYRLARQMGRGLAEAGYTVMTGYGTIDPRDLELVHVTDDVDEAIERIRRPRGG